MTSTILQRVTALAGLSALLMGAAAAAPPTAFSLVESIPKTLSPAAALSADRAATPGAISADRKTLTFLQKTVRLVVHSGPASDMLSYRIDGLRNPTLIVPRGATLKVLSINTDDDMFHNLRFSTRKASNAVSVGTPDLAHRTEAAFHAQDLRLRVPVLKGIYYYLCTVRGHAQGGMYGAIIVR